MQKFSIGTKVVNKTYGKGIVVYYNEVALEKGLQPYAVKYESMDKEGLHNGELRAHGYYYKSDKKDCRYHYEHELEGVIETQGTEEASVLQSILEMEEDNTGREGCTYADTDYDSQSVVYGRNSMLEEIKTLIQKRLKK